MGDAPRPDASASGDRLEGWKEIGAYIGRSARTAERYEKTEKLPVFREGGKVFAFTGELDRWRAARAVRAEPEATPPEPALPVAPPPRASKYVRAAMIALAATLVLSAGIFWPSEVTLLSTRQITRDGRPKDGRAVSDGSRIFFSEFIEGSGSLRLSSAPLEAEGGLVTGIDLPLADPEVMQFSPARRALLIQDPVTHRYFDLPISSLTPREIAAHEDPGLRSHAGSWDATGRYLAVTGSTRLLLMDGGGAAPSRALPFMGDVESVAWRPSPAEARVEVRDIKSGSAAWFDVGIGGVPRRLPPLSGKRIERNGDWSYDGNFFVFEARDSPEDGPSQIWLADYSHAGAPRAYRLTQDDRIWRDPVFVPGSYTVLASSAQSQGRLARLGSTAAEAGGQRALLPGAPGV